MDNLFNHHNDDDDTERSGITLIGGGAKRSAFDMTSAPMQNFGADEEGDDDGEQLVYLNLDDPEVMKQVRDQIAASPLLDAVIGLVMRLRMARLESMTPTKITDGETVRDVEVSEAMKLHVFAVTDFDTTQDEKMWRLDNGATWDDVDLIINLERDHPEEEQGIRGMVVGRTIVELRNVEEFGAGPRWIVVKRIDDSGELVDKPPVLMTNDDMVALIAEAAPIYAVPVENDEGTRDVEGDGPI